MTITTNEATRAMHARLSAIAPDCPPIERNRLLEAAAARPSAPVDEIIAMRLAEFPGETIDDLSSRFGMPLDVVSALLETSKRHRLKA